MNDLVSILIILGCIVMSGYFSATETAFTSLDIIQIKALSAKGNKRAMRVLKISKDFDGMLSTILIGNNIVNILAASLATVLFVGWIDSQTGPTVSTIVMTIVVLIFGEISPKSIAKQSPEAFAMLSSGLLMVFMIILTPINWVFRQWKKLLNIIFKPKGKAIEPEEKLMTIVSEAERAGSLEADEGQIIKSAIEFNDLEVGDIFIPRIDVTAIDVNTDIKKILQIFNETRYSRLPVYDKEFDNPIGLLHLKDFIYELQRNKDFDIRKILKDVIYVTKTKKISDLLKDFQENQAHLAFVINEYSSIAGIITIEDILEELVGDIWDEHENAELEISKINANSYAVSGKCSIVKLFNYLSLDVEIEALTVNGWVMSELNCIPQDGMHFDYMVLSVDINSVISRRVDKVIIVDNRIKVEE